MKCLFSGIAFYLAKHRQIEVDWTRLEAFEMEFEKDAESQLDGQKDYWGNFFIWFIRRH